MNLPTRNFLGVLSFMLLSLDIGVEGTVGPLGMKSGSLSALFIVAWSSLFRGYQANTEVEQHLELGKKLLAAGQLSDALSHYHAAVEGDPTNYMIYYRRATVYLALGKSRSALPDLDKVIELKPDFLAARLQRANVKMKQGQLNEAEMDYKSVLETNSGHEEATRHLDEISNLRIAIDTAKQLRAQNDFHGTIEHLEPVIELCPWDPNLRELRAECYEAVGDYFKAISDIRPTAKLRSDNTQAYFRISTLLYKMGDAEQSLNDIRECLKLDPDHKECFPHYKKVKKLAKQMNSVLDLINEQRWEDCLDKVNQMLKTEPSESAFVNRAIGHRCHCYSKAQLPKEALEACDEILKMEPNNVEALCDRADAYIDNEQLEEAVEDFRKAEEVDQNHKRAQEGSKRAQKLLKQSQKRDYYKILGVKRNARKKEIIKAYRKLAAEWHPDKHEGDDKEMAEKKFIDIASAKEVLTDPEKRQKFDNGEDPLDAEEQAGGNHWQHGGHGFNPFGNSGFQFKFHFN